ncbi:MAG: acyloxyacyl hydrolase [Mariprofundaceae bacterium]
MRVLLRRMGFFCIYCLVWVKPACAVDAVFVDGGASVAPNGWVAQLGARWDWGWRKALTETWRAGGAWQLALACGHWNDKQQDGISVDVSLTPEIRLAWRRDAIIEGGVGVHFIANRPSQRLSTAMEFGSLVGAGYQVTEHVLMGYRFWHLSNAGVRQPNAGVNIHLLHLEYRY